MQSTHACRSRALLAITGASLAAHLLIVQVATVNATSEKDSPSAPPRPAPILSQEADDRPLVVAGVELDPNYQAKVKQAFELIESGRLLLEKGKVEEAIKAFTEAIKVHDTWIPHLYLAEIFFEQDNARGAVEHYRLALYDWPVATAGQVAGADGGRVQAPQGGSPAPAVLPRIRLSDPGDLMRFAIVLSRSGFSDEAVRVYDEGWKALTYLRTSKQRMDWPVALSVVFDGRHREAVYSPARLQAAAHTALAMMEGPADPGKAPAVLGHLDKALRLQPSLAIAHFYKGVAFKEMYGREAEADAALFKAAAYGRADVKAAVEQVRKQ